MHAIWNGSATAPQNNTTNFAYVTNTLQKAWQGQENTNAFGDSCIALSDAVVITKITFYVTNAPGGSTSWNFTIRKNATTDTSATVTITGAATSATWSGSVSFTQLDLISLSSVPTGGPAASGNIFWTIEYDSVGSDYYLAMGNNGGQQNFDLFSNPFSPCPFSGTATDYEVVIPTDLTVVRIAASQAIVSNGSYIYTVRKNNTTDLSVSATITGTDVSAVSGAGSLVFAPGDRMVVKRTGGASNWIGCGYSITIVPSYAGEVVSAFGNNAIPSSTVAQYEGPRGIGNLVWDNTEANVYMRVAACSLTKLNVRLTTASGAGTSYAFTLRSNTADTTITTTLSNTTTGSDITHTAVHSDGNFLSIKITPTSTPAATAGVKIGFVQLVAQPAVSTSVTALLGTTAAYSSTQTVGMTFSGYVPQIGDIIYFFINNSVGATAITTPAGWVNVLGGNNISAAGAACSSVGIYHVVTAAEVTAVTTAYTATNLFNSGATGRAGGCVLRGADSVVFVDDFNTTSSSSGTTTHVLSGLTGANLSTGSLILGGLGGSNLATYTVPSGWTQVILNSGGTTAMGLMSNNTPTTAGSNVASTNVTCSVSMAYSNITVAVLPSDLPGPVAYNATGTIAIGSNITNGQSASSTHTASGSKRFVILTLVAVQANPNAANYTAYSRVATYGGVSMSSLGGMHYNNDSTVGWIEVFYLFNPPTGSQTVQISVTKSPVANVLSIFFNTVSYTGVSSLSSLSTAFGAAAGTTESQVFSSASGRMIAQGFAVANAMNPSYNQTSRWSSTVSNVGDAPGASSVTFSSSRSSGNAWAAIGLELMPTDSTQFFDMF
jgi:hypothetical protein